MRSEIAWREQVLNHKAVLLAVAVIVPIRLAGPPICKLIFQPAKWLIIFRVQWACGNLRSDGQERGAIGNSDVGAKMRGESIDGLPHEVKVSKIRRVCIRRNLFVE